MLTWAITLGILYLTFAVYWLLQWWLGRHIQGLALLIFNRPASAAGIYFWLLAPGVILHELSHWLMAKLLFVPTGKISLFRPGKNRRENNKVVLGYVEVFKSDPLRQSLIGLAPLISGLGMLLLLSGILNFHNGYEDSQHLGQTLSYLPGDLVNSFSNLLNILWLYLVFSISNGMLPSAADRKPWLLGFVLPGVILLALGLAGYLPSVSSEFQLGVLKFLGNLTWIFSFAATINLLLALIIMTLEYLISRLKRRKVVYNRKG